MDLIQADPVTCARYYKHHMDALFVLMRGRGERLFGGKVPYSCSVDEFQKRGTPHRHAVLWVEGGPRVNKAPDEAVEQFYGKLRSTASSGLSDFLVMAQRHRCRKVYCLSKGRGCRFKAPWFPLPRARLIRPFAEGEAPPADMSIEMLTDACASIRAELLQLDKVMAEVSDLSDPRRARITSMTFAEFCELCKLSEEQYMAALRTDVQHATLWCQREVRDMCINAYHPELLALNQGNMDIQAVTDEYAAAMYMTGYLCKRDLITSRLLREAALAASGAGKGVAERIRTAGNILINSQELSAQQAVFDILGMSLHRQSHDTVLVPSSARANRVFMLKSAADLESPATGLARRRLLQRGGLLHLLPPGQGLREPCRPR